MSAATRKLKYGGLATLPLPEPKINTHGAVGVDPHELLQFLLPTGFFHSKSTARLYIFAECGPTLVKVREGWMSLRAGYKGMHVVTEQELEDMIHEMIREDILRVYVGNAILTPTEQEEVISQADPALKSIPNYTKEEFEELLAPGTRTLARAQNHAHAAGMPCPLSRLLLPRICTWLGARRYWWAPQPSHAPSFPPRPTTPCIFPPFHRPLPLRRPPACVAQH